MPITPKLGVVVATAFEIKDEYCPLMKNDESERTELTIEMIETLYEERKLERSESHVVAVAANHKCQDASYVTKEAEVAVTDDAEEERDLTLLTTVSEPEELCVEG